MDERNQKTGREEQPAKPMAAHAKPLPPTDASTAGASTTAEETTAAGERTDLEAELAEDVSAVTSEMRRFGQQLAAALRAAANTPEAEALRTDVREGMQQLRGEVDQALETAPEKLRSKAGGRQDTVGALRSDLAGALRALNSAVERAAARLAPDAEEPPEQVAAAAEGMEVADNRDDVPSEDAPTQVGKPK